MSGNGHRGVLFDVDGVLLDTGAFFEHIWRDWAARRSLDPEHVATLAHGRRTDDTLREVAPHLDPVRERRLLDEIVVGRLGEIRPARGAAELLPALAPTPWGLVSSGSRWFTQRCFQAAGLPFPAVAVFGEDVRNGKPAPDGYLAAARQLRIPATACVVVEDAPAGIAAARSAGCAVVALTTTHPAQQLAGADVCLPSLSAAAELLLTRRDTGDVSVATRAPRARTT
jgi:sugar-phosphatase